MQAMLAMAQRVMTTQPAAVVARVDLRAIIFTPELAMVAMEVTPEAVVEEAVATLRVSLVATPSRRVRVATAVTERSASSPIEAADGRTHRTHRARRTDWPSWSYWCHRPDWRHWAHGRYRRNRCNG
jgi:hypothetical protein